MTKLYAHWVNCIKDECPESNKGKCDRAKYERNKEVVYGEPAEFPKDGKCLFPEFQPYNEEWEDGGVYEQAAGENETNVL
jgi:hypothetical protein